MHCVYSYKYLAMQPGIFRGPVRVWYLWIAARSAVYTSMQGRSQDFPKGGGLRFSKNSKRGGVSPGPLRKKAEYLV